MRFGAIVAFIAAWSLVVYAPLAHMVWGGEGSLIGDVIGALDFAGGDVVHISSGVTGLILCLFLGGRKGFGLKSYRPHNVPFVALGAGLRQAQAGQGILRQDAHFHRPIERGSQDGDAPVDRRLAKAPHFLEFHELKHVFTCEAYCLALAIKREDMRGMVCRLLCRCPIGQRDGKVSLKELFHRHARA